MVADPFRRAAGSATLPYVTSDQELTLIFGAIHLLALVFGGVLFWMFLHSETAPAWEPPDDEESDGGGGGGNDRLGAKPKKPVSPGGLPLPDAAQAKLRLRGPGRLADAYPPAFRRPDHEPGRTPERV